MTLERMPFLTEEQVAVIHALKIPVDSFNPGHYWIASLDRESAMPTADELKKIRSYIDYAIQQTYNLTYQERILAKPLPVEGGHNTVVLRKGALWIKQDPIYETPSGEITHVHVEGARLVNGGDPCEGWCYRRISWTGDGYWPKWPKPRVNLIDVLDEVHSFGRGDLYKPWVKWKLEHPDVFSPEERVIPGFGVVSL